MNFWKAAAPWRRPPKG